VLFDGFAFPLWRAVECAKAELRSAEAMVS
jgi:hypothetical protein